MIPQQDTITSLTIFNQIGQQMLAEDQGKQADGEHSHYFRADDLPSGIYFYQVRAGNLVKTKKMVLLR